MPTLRSVSGTQAASACGQPHVRAVAEPARLAWCRCGSGGGGVADPLRRVRSVVAVRDGNDRVAVPAAQGRVGVCVRRPSAVGAVGAVSVDHRGRCRARVADVGVGRDGGGGLHEAGRRLPAVGEGLGEMQGPREERGDRRRDHRLPGRSPHATARQIQHRRTLSGRRPHHLAQAAGAVPARVRSRPGRRARSGGRRLPRSLAQQPFRQRVRDARRLLRQSTPLVPTTCSARTPRRPSRQRRRPPRHTSTDPWRTIGARSSGACSGSATSARYPGLVDAPFGASQMSRTTKAPQKSQHNPLTSAQPEL